MQLILGIAWIGARQTSWVRAAPALSCPEKYYPVGTNPQTYDCEECDVSYCEVGEYLQGCGGSSQGSCVPCSHRPESAHFITSGGFTDACEYECNAGYTWVQGTCVICDPTDCESGTYLPSGGDTCVPCTNKPEHSQYSGSCGNSETCPFECDDGYHIGVYFCKKCHGRFCEVGEYLKGCGKNHPGKCVNCAAPPAYAIHTTNGGLLDACLWECGKPPPNAITLEHDPGEAGRVGMGPESPVLIPPGEQEKGKCPWKCPDKHYWGGIYSSHCMPCNKGCPLGKFLYGCGTVSSGRCKSCPGSLPPNARYKGLGSVEDVDNVEIACDWGCVHGYVWENTGLGERCEACSDVLCPVGKYRYGCYDIHNGECLKCSNVPPVNGSFFSHSGVVDVCPWICNAGSFRTGESCMNCMDCPSGQYRFQCGNVSAGECTPCTNAPMNATYFSSGGLVNECKWGCDEGFFQAGGKCLPCASCPVGSFRVGCQGAESGECDTCTHKPRYSEFVSDGGLSDACPWFCSSGFYQNGSAFQCLQCAADCPTGEFRDSCGSEVNRSSPGYCVPCGSPPPRAHYIGSGGLQGTCPWICNSGLYWASGSCKECAVSRCDVGQYLHGCKETHEGSCESCTNRAWLSHFVSAGGVSSESCSIECSFGWPLKLIPLPLTPSPCLLILVIVISLILVMLLMTIRIAIHVKHARRRGGVKIGVSPAAAMAGVEYKAHRRVVVQNGGSEECSPMISAPALENGQVGEVSGGYSGTARAVSKAPLQPRAARPADTPSFWQHRGDS